MTKTKTIGKVASQAELARALDYDHSTVSRHVKRGMREVRNKDGTWDVQRCRAWIKAWKDKGGSTPEDARAHDVRWRKARADKLELENAQARGELVPRDQYEQDLRERAQAFRRSLAAIQRALALTLAHTCDPNEVQVLLEKAHNRMLQSVYERQGAPTTNGYGSVA